MVTPKNVQIDLETEMVTLIVVCFCCGKDITVNLSTDEYHDYFIEGMKVQDAMPNQLPDIRELLISGTCGTCFDEMFKDQDEE